MSPLDADAYSLASAQRAAREDRLAAWVVDFLASPGSDNGALAAALALSPTAYLGPVRLPLELLTPLAGPDGEDVIVPVAAEIWEPVVEAMARRLDEGWDIPPLLVSHHDGRYYLEDGNHRHETLRRRGCTEAWVILSFADADARDRFLLDHAAEIDGDGRIRLTA